MVAIFAGESSRELPSRAGSRRSRADEGRELSKSHLGLVEVVNGPITRTGLHPTGHASLLLGHHLQQPLDLVFVQFRRWEQSDLRLCQGDESGEVVGTRRLLEGSAATDPHLPRKTASRLLPGGRLKVVRACRGRNERTAHGARLEVVKKKPITHGDLAVVMLEVLPRVGSEQRAV